MKFGSPFSVVMTRVEHQARQSRDYLALGRRLRLSSDHHQIALVLTVGDGPRPYAMTDLLHDQLADATGVPLAYYRRMRSDAPELLVSNVNTWLGRTDQRHVVRTLDDPQRPMARALLSDRYLPLDHDALLAAVLPVLREEGVTISSCELTDRRLYIKALNQRVTGAVKVGETVMAGIAISNSEVGLGALAIQPLMFTKRCTNGMILEDLSLRRHHVGRRHDGEDGIIHLLTDETRQADNRAFFLRVRDVTRAALDAAVFRQHLGKMQAAVHQAIPEALAERVIEVTAKRFHLSVSEGAGVLGHLRATGDYSRWGLCSAITRQSQDIGSYDRATDLERIGGQVLELPMAGWSQLVGMN